MSVLAQSVLWGMQASLQTHLFPEVLTPLGFLDQFSSSLFVPWVSCREEGGSSGIAPRGLPNIPLMGWLGPKGGGKTGDLELQNASG